MKLLNRVPLVLAMTFTLSAVTQTVQPKEASAGVIIVGAALITN